MKLGIHEARRLWAAAQHLSGSDSPWSLPGGWMRALGGVDPYLALHARSGVSRSQVDAQLVQGRVRVVPSVRGCIWLVPLEDVSLCLRVSSEQARGRTLRELAALGVSEADLLDLGERVLLALERGPLSPADLRSALPEGAVLSLGAAGKKKGHNTTLPAAIRLLEWSGQVSRVLSVLDTERYLWGLAQDRPLELGISPTDVGEQALELAGRFFDWAGPASPSEFVTWSGLGKRVSNKAIAQLGLIELEIEGLEEPRFATEASLSRRGATGWSLLPAQDNLLSLRASPALLAEPAFHEVELQSMGRGLGPLRDTRWMFHRCVFHEGSLVGLWDWDEDARELLVGGFGEPLDLATPDLAALCADLGVLRANAIDGEKSRRKRWDRVRQLS